ncbi:MAG: hypothetical protein ACRENP_20450 [Longimicrobiales bacterium]
MANPPTEGMGGLMGTVTLLGTGGPPNPAGIRITLYAAPDIETKNARYEALLRRIPGAARTYEYIFPHIEPG